MGAPQNKNLKRFPRTLDLTDFGITADKTCVAQTYSLIGTYTVGAQQEATFGISTLRSGGVEGEPIYIRFDEAVGAGTQLTGRVRLVLSNAQGTERVVVLEERTERLSASQYDRTQAPLLVEYPVNAKEDSKLLIEFRVDDATNQTLDFDGTNTKVLIPATIYQ